MRGVNLVLMCSSFCRNGFTSSLRGIVSWMMSPLYALRSSYVQARTSLYSLMRFSIYLSSSEALSNLDDLGICFWPNVYLNTISRLAYFKLSFIHIMFLKYIIKGITVKIFWQLVILQLQYFKLFLASPSQFTWFLKIYSKLFRNITTWVLSWKTCQCS